MSMIDFQQGLALFEISFTSIILLLCFVQCYFNVTLSIPQKMLMTLISIPAFLWPLDFMGLPTTLPLAAYIRGIIGELSVVTSLLLWSYFFSTTPRHIPSRLKWGIVFVGLFFYPCALGIGMIDPYAWGYGSLLFLTAIAAIIFYLCWVAWYREAVILALAIVAWAFTLHESTNLWDYLLDPFLFLWCTALCIEEARLRKNMVE